MPHGKGTYGSKVGRPPKKKKTKATKRKAAMPKMKAKRPSMIRSGRMR